MFDRYGGLLGFGVGDTDKRLLPLHQKIKKLLLHHIWKTTTTGWTSKKSSRKPSTMPEIAAKKRVHEGKPSRPAKKQKKQQYHTGNLSNFVDKDGEDFPAVNLLDSDDEALHIARADDGAASGEEGSSSAEDVVKPTDTRKTKLKKPLARTARDAPVDETDSEDGSSTDGEDDDHRPRTHTLKKRNDPTAFATSVSKIISTKLSTTRRADPALVRSAAAHQASKATVDTALDAKARKQLRAQRKEALERGRVRDVLVATTTSVAAGDREGSTAEILEMERRLRKVAQRGVVKLFNAVRAAQVRASEAERGARAEGVVGSGRKAGKVNEMSNKGFLELIASGGGNLKKGALEEA